MQAMYQLFSSDTFISLDKIVITLRKYEYDLFVNKLMMFTLITPCVLKQYSLMHADNAINS